MTDRTRLTVLQLAVVVGVCLFCFFFGLGAFGLVGADEPRYAQIGREMLARHDWVLPTINGQPWLEKPVLLYWGEMISYRLFGVRDWAARVPSALFATVLVLAIFAFLRRFREGTELDGALIAVTMAGIIGFARGASTDMQLSAPFCLALLAWWTWRQSGKKLWLAVFFVLLAIAALAKGPVAPVFALLIVGAYCWLRHEGESFLQSLWLPGFGLFFLISLPWYVLVQRRATQFFRTFFLQHNLERFGTNLYQHSQPFWYYIPVFLLMVLPWVVFTVPGLVEAVRTAWTDRRVSEAAVADPVEKDDGLNSFLVVWILVPIIFFSISRSKLPGYILPSIPPAAILTAIYLHRAGISRLKLMLHSLICGILMAGALVAPFSMMKEPIPMPARYITAVSAGVIAILVLLYVRKSGLRVLRFVTAVPVVLGLMLLLRLNGLTIDETQSSRDINVHLNQLGAGNSPVAVFQARRDVEYGLNFYRNQPVPRYERDGVPGFDHIVIAKQGSLEAVQALITQGAVSRMGDFPPQHLEFFRVTFRK